MSLPIEYREANLEDRDFIFRNWLKYLRKEKSTWFCPNEIFFEIHKRMIKELLRRSKTIMFCNPEDLNHVYGFLCFEETPKRFVVHYLYMKDLYRLTFGVEEEALKKFLSGSKEKAMRYSFHSIWEPFLKEMGGEYFPSMVRELASEINLESLWRKRETHA